MSEPAMLKSLPVSGPSCGAAPELRAQAKLYDRLGRMPVSVA